MFKEEWKDLKDYEGIYKISNTGKILSINYRRSGKPSLLKYATDKDGYLLVGLNNNGNKKLKKVHRMVAKTFIPNPNNYPIVNHKDENPANNRVDNLEWCTQKYNANYGTRIERMQKSRGIKVYQYSLNGKLFKQWDSIRQCERGTKIKHMTIVECCKKIKIHKGYIWSYHLLKQNYILPLIERD